MGGAWPGAQRGRIGLGFLAPGPSGLADGSGNPRRLVLRRLNRLLNRSLLTVKRNLCARYQRPERVQSPPTSDTLEDAIEIPSPGANTEAPPGAVVETDDADEPERPTVIVPRPRAPSAINPSEPDAATARTAPHLVELPLSFQKRVPDLIFNSHIYASCAVGPSGHDQ